MGDSNQTPRSRTRQIKSHVTYHVHPFFYLPRDFIPRLPLDKQVRRVQVFQYEFLIGYLLVVQVYDELLHGRIARKEVSRRPGGVAPTRSGWGGGGSLRFGLRRF